MDEATGPSIGQRLREVRALRGMSQREVAQLAGFTQAYLSQIENGLKPVDRRSTLEALARAAKIAPSDLAGVAIADRLPDPEVSAAEATITGLETVLSEVGFGDVAVAPRAWEAIAADLGHLNAHLRPTTDYAGQGTVLPGLITELQALVNDPTAPREQVLIGLVQCYHAAVAVARNLGIRGLPALASWHARRAAEELNDPAWIGLAEWLRASSIGGGSRDRASVVALQAAADLEPHLGDQRAREIYGSLHLQASLSAAATTRPDAANEHLDEADDVARSLAQKRRPSCGFGALYFNSDNIGIWRLSIAVELGEVGRVREIAAGVDISQVPSAARQAVYWSDLGRGLSGTRATAEEAVSALRRAEEIAPVYVRTRPLVRETVTHLLRRARRDAGGRELRGMAYRMGIAG